MRKWYYEVSRNDSTAIKGIAIILMLLHHVFAFPNRMANGAHYIPMIPLPDGTSVIWHLAIFGKVCVAMFTVLAGFGIYRSFSKQLLDDRDNDHTQTYLNFFIRRLSKLYFKVWPVFLVFIPIGLFLNCPFVTRDICSWIKNALLIDTTFNAEWWFLTSYAALVILSPMVMAFFNRKRSSFYSDFIIISILAVFIERVLLYGIGSSQTVLLNLRVSYIWVKFSTILILLPMFMLGAWAAKYDVVERILNRYRGSNVKRILIGIALTLIVFFVRDGWKQPNVWGFDQFDGPYGAVLTLALILVICKFNVLKKILVVIGNQATGIWLIHSFFCFYYFQQFTYSPKYSILVFLLVFSASFASAWIIDFCANFLVNKVRGTKRIGDAKFAENENSGERPANHRFRRRYRRH